MVVICSNMDVCKILDGCLKLVICIFKLAKETRIKAYKRIQLGEASLPQFSILDCH
jgi:hypothetical protein